MEIAYTPLSDGSSASQEADLNGPTAVLYQCKAKTLITEYQQDY